jgi:hypothetical protein
MNHSASNSNHPAEDASKCIPCLFSIWLLVQLTSLGLAAVGIEFTSRWPRPAQQLALHQMLAVQIVFASLLFPWLMPSWRISMAVIAISWPMCVLAAALAECSNQSLLAGASYTTAWLALLAIASQQLRTQYLQCMGVLVAALATLGGAVLWYLAEEFGDGATLSACGALVGAIAQVSRPFTTPVAWATVIGPLLFGSLVLFIFRDRAAVK